MELTDKQILLTGAGGLLGQRLVRKLGHAGRIFSHYHRRPENSPEKDIYAGDLGQPDHVARLSKEIAPDIIINTAALTDVDRCEVEPARSKAINADAVNHLAKYFPNARLIHLSTDYLFDGRNTPRPGDAPAPLNVYGRNKWEAEKTVLAASPDNLVIRTNTMYDVSARRNFFRFLYDNLTAGRAISCAIDQISNPLTALRAADLVVRLIEREARKIFHIGGSEFVSRYELARFLAKNCAFDPTLIRPVDTETLARPAARPLKAGLDCSATESFLACPMLSLAEDLANLKKLISETRS